jgi:hypothetical protein
MNTQLTFVTRSNFDTRKFNTIARVSKATADNIEHIYESSIAGALLLK